MEISLSQKEVNRIISFIIPSIATEYFNNTCCGEGDSSFNETVFNNLNNNPDVIEGIYLRVYK